VCEQAVFLKAFRILPVVFGLFVKKENNKYFGLFAPDPYGDRPPALNPPFPFCFCF
jgi:hypothetical protein